MTPRAGGPAVISVLTALFTRRTWRDVAYVLTGVVVGAPAFVLALVGVAATALSILTVGLPVLIAVLAVARHLPAYFRVPARGLLGWDWPRPAPLDARGVLRRVVALLGDGTAWRALLYSFTTFPVRVAGAYAAAIALVLGPVGLTYPLWWFIVPDGWGMDPTDWAGTWTWAWQGAALLLVMPWVLRLVVAADRLLVRALLEPTGGSARIAALESSRAELRADAAATLRRVERDLHDGTQARLVALGMTLGRIAHRTDDPQVRTLVDDARGTVTEALAELRDIVRGLHPPALDDGLPVALQTLAGRSAVPVELAVPTGLRPSDNTASAVYFAVAELLTNIARHASATRVRVEVQAADGRIRLAVTDDGRGGARPDGLGTGLAGLARRATALDGTFTVDSPAGGPTVVTMTLPGEG
ncbi:sensor histidine kinase [Krasilnikovia sp. MM14-A1259]|uniref:sensor histidine kinase n=1 Tax=Krasilnikovia sp. MM14-A1259 TaxID=3373539 RepID=UPI0038040218